MDYKKTADFFAKNNYVVVKNFINKGLAKFMYDYTILKNKSVKHLITTNYVPDGSFCGTFEDGQVNGVYSCYGDWLMETLLETSVVDIKNITGLNLVPTYSYYRVYLNGSELKRHKDRPSCEVSATLCLGYNNSGAPTGYNWGMFIEKSGKKDLKGKEIFMEPGDMIVYRGCNIEHWRNKFKGKNLSQVFLHFNDAEGPFIDYCKYDGRPMLGLPPDYKDPQKVEKMLELNDVLLKEGKLDE